jgi:hypothetical protein
MIKNFIGTSCNDSSIKEVQASGNEKAETTEINADSLKREENWRAFEESFKLENYLVSSIPSKDFITVTEKAGVFISPDSIQIEHLKKENGEEDFYTVADDNIYFQHEASKFLKGKKFKVIHPKARYIKFVSKGKEFYFDTKSKAAVGWTAILFSPEKPSPKVVNAADIELEYQEYFK